MGTINTEMHRLFIFITRMRYKLRLLISWERREERKIIYRVS